MKKHDSALHHNEGIVPQRATHQSKLGVRTGVHSKLKVAGTQAHDGAALTSHDGRGHKSICQARARGHRYKVRAGTFLSI